VDNLSKIWEIIGLKKNFDLKCKIEVIGLKDVKRTIKLCKAKRLKRNFRISFDILDIQNRRRF